MTHFLKFPDERTALNAIDAAGFAADGQVIAASHTHALDVVGEIVRGGEWDDDGNVVVPPTTLDGWHVNFIGDLPPEWEQYTVNPQHPARVFA